METIISVLVIAFAIGVALYVEMFMCKKILTGQEVLDYQRELDQINAKARENYGLELKLNAETRLLESRKEKKSFVLIFSGIAIAFVLILLLFSSILSFTNIAIMCISAIMLICYGMIKMAESRKLAIALLVLILIIGILTKIAFDKAIEISPWVYLYLCILVALIGVLSLFEQKNKC